MLQGKLHVDVGFWGGLVPGNSGNTAELQGMLDAGALGLKCFLAPSGECGIRAMYSIMKVMRNHISF